MNTFLDPIISKRQKNDKIQIIAFSKATTCKKEQKNHLSNSSSTIVPMSAIERGNEEYRKNITIYK